MRMVVTGGAGFVGSNLAHALAGAGHEVGILDAFVPGSGANEANLEGFAGPVQRADIREPAKYAAFLRGAERVVHLAAHVSHVDSMTDPEHDLRHNALGTLRLLEAVREEAPQAHFIYGGTRGQYGAVAAPPATPESPLCPTDIYGVNKTAGEQYALVLSRTGALVASSVRFTNCYGPRHQMAHAKWGTLNWFLRRALDNADLTVYGEGAQLREYAYIGDIAQALVALCEADPAAANGRILNLGAPERVSFRQMAEAVVAAAGSGRVTTVPWPDDRKAIEVGDFISDDSAARELLGWKPTTSLTEGLAKTVAFYRERLSLYT